MRPQTVLIVDDEPDIRRVVGEILQDEGWNIHHIQATEWYWHPEVELERLEALLAKIRSNF